jgi:hypothetical protein
MNFTSTATSTEPTTTAPSSAFTDFVLKRLRVARIRAMLVVHDIEEIGIALKSGAISPEIALLDLDQCGAMGLFPSSSEAA